MDSKPGTSKGLKSGENSKERKFKPNPKGSNRYKSYSKTRNEGQGFADVRKKKAAREYLKYLQKEQKKDETCGSQVQPPLRLYDILSRSDSKKPKGSLNSHLQKIAAKKQKLKDEEREKSQKDKEASEAAIKNYKRKKKENFLKLCKKTSKGQPVMKNKMEVLLQKIMKHKGKDGDSEDAKG